MSAPALLSRALLVLVQVLVLVLVLVQVQTCGASSPALPLSLDVRPDASSGSHCASCALARMRRSEEEAQQEVVEAVKRHILTALHLLRRPNVTRPVPRAALLNALRKLHVGRVAEDGSVHIEGGEEARGGGGGGRGGGGRGGRGGGRGGGKGGAVAERMGDSQETTEIITFAEAGASPGLVDFVVSRERGGVSVVEQAAVWLFLRLPKTNRSRAKVTIRLLQQRRPAAGRPCAAPDGALLAEKAVDTRRSGWHTFPVSAAVQALLEDSAGGAALSLRASCPLCAAAGASLVLVSAGAGQRDQSHRPFLMAVVRRGDGGAGSPRRRKRGLECDGKARVCCKRQFYVNFKDIGWNDWIIAPPGYHANYCEGDCPAHVASVTGSSLSFHSTVIGHYRLRGYSPFQSLRSCCVPSSLRAMSMLYYDEEQQIIKKDIDDMVVEECGCS